ncbi:MAG: ATP-binding cassette domain-containing protein [Verrucomicrobiota bacterium]|nr:ATP-binding cassette domain-containing protein [Verrucomicrobiota bacterium]
MIRIRNLWKRYGSNDVLKGLNLDVNEGEILVILGRSGVGKSVLLRQIIGIEKPDQGTVEVGGVMISSLKKKELFQAVKQMGMLFQSSALFDSMNVEENTIFYLKQHGKPPTGTPYSIQELEALIVKSLNMVGLLDARKKMPSDLSGGMRKRAGLARLIAYRPHILLYDEPTTGLDPITAQQINELIVSTQEELNGTSIVVTHDINSALYIADRIALHRDGQIVHVAPPDEFLKIDEPIINFLRETLELKKRKPKKK